jgi:hypothetical protein
MSKYYSKKDNRANLLTSREKGNATPDRHSNAQVSSGSNTISTRTHCGDGIKLYLNYGTEISNQARKLIVTRWKNAEDVGPYHRVCVVTKADRSETRLANGYLLRGIDAIDEREAGQSSANTNSNLPLELS